MGYGQKKGLMMRRGFRIKPLHPTRCLLFLSHIETGSNKTLANSFSRTLGIKFENVFLRFPS